MMAGDKSSGLYRTYADLEEYFYLVEATHQEFEKLKGQMVESWPELESNEPELYERTLSLYNACEPSTTKRRDVRIRDAYASCDAYLSVLSDKVALCKLAG